MVVKHSPSGLIAATRSRATPLLTDVAVCCGWPLLLEATPRRLQHELALHNPECVLYWLDDRRDVSPTAHLVTWSRHRGARPYRVAVAFRLDDGVEAILRAAGAHSFLPLSDQSGTTVADALERLLQESAPSVEAVDHKATFAPAIRSRAASLEIPAESVRPP